MSLLLVLPVRGANLGLLPATPTCVLPRLVKLVMDSGEFSAEELAEKELYPTFVLV